MKNNNSEEYDMLASLRRRAKEQGKLNVN